MRTDRSCMHHDHKLKANENRCWLVGNIKVCIWARFFSLDHGLSRNLSFLPYLERWDLLDISRTLYAEVHKEKFTPKFFYYLLLKFENFWTSTPWVMDTLVHYLESVFIILIHKFFPYHTPYHCFRWPTLSKGKCVTCITYKIEKLLLPSPLRVMIGFVPPLFWIFGTST